MNVFCYHCGEKIISDDAIHCPHCGAKQKQQNADTVKANQSSNEHKIKNQTDNNINHFKNLFKIKHPKIILIPLTCLAVICILFHFFYIKPATPQETANNFLDYLKSGDYNKAYKMLNFNTKDNNSYLTTSNFANTVKQDYGKIISFSLNNSNSNQDTSKMTSYNITATIKNDKDKYINLNLHLVKSQVDGNSNWQIVSSSLTTNVHIFSIPGATIDIGGQKSTVPNNGNIDLPVFYPTKVTLSIPGAVAVTKDISQTSNEISVTVFKANDDVKNNLSNLVKNEDAAWINAIETENYVPLEKYIKKGSQEEKDCQDIIDGEKGSNYRNSYAISQFTVKSVIFSTMNRILLTSEEAWQISTKIVSTGNVITQYSPNKVYRQYTLDKQGNSWFISDINEYPYNGQDYN